MKRNNDIYSFIQTLYKDYGIKDSLISYGYSDASETFIVKIDDAEALSNIKLQKCLFHFSQAMADKGIWMLFVSPEDCIHFDDFETIGREWSSEQKSQAQKNDLVVYTQYPSVDWDFGDSFSKVGIAQVVASVNTLDYNYAFAA